MSDFGATGIGERAADLIAQYAHGIDNVDLVVLRNLNLSDNNGTLGISLDHWSPEDWEMAGDGSLEPTIQSYFYSLQHLLKWATAEEGERIHREVAKGIRLMLYRNPDLQLSLRSLFVQEDSRRERIQKFRITNQRYGTTESGSGTFVFMSVTDLLIETEAVTTF